MSFTRKGDTYGWTYCDRCQSVNGDVHGQVILCKCDRAEVQKSIDAIDKKFKGKKLQSIFKVVEPKKKKKQKKSTKEVDILKYKNDYEAGY